MNTAGEYNNNSLFLFVILCLFFISLLVCLAHFNKILFIFLKLSSWWLDELTILCLLVYFELAYTYIQPVQSPTICYFCCFFVHFHDNLECKTCIRFNYRRMMNPFDSACICLNFAEMHSPQMYAQSTAKVEINNHFP